MGYFFDYLKIDQSNPEVSFKDLTQKARVDSNWIANAIFKYLHHHKRRVERKEISSATLRNYVKPIRLYCEQLDIPIPWKKIMRGMPKGRRYANDRAPTLEEIKKLLAYPDRRIRPIIFTMTSSAIRLSAWDYLKWKHIIPVLRDDKIIAAKIIDYADDDEEYLSFISREAYDSLDDWMTFRKQSGETVTGESWVMRNLWDVTTPRGKGVVTIPKKLKATGLKRLMERALWAEGVRMKLAEGKKRHEFQADHGFRKWFKTRCESAGMRSINIETLMGHSLGISDSYYRPTEDEILHDYLKAIDDLTLVRDNLVLKQEVTELKEKNRDEYSSLESRLREREQEIFKLRDETSVLKEAVLEMQNLLRYPKQVAELSIEKP